MYKNSNILITGGTGSWGVELIRQLLTFQPNKIIIYSRNENSQVELKRNIEDSRLCFYIGDIRDREAVIEAAKSIDIIFHLAALKHVPVCEENPLEAIKTNIIGTQHVIEAAIENNVNKVIYVSTDKAADPANTYGMTKALGERLIIHANSKKTGTKFTCVRGGNVLGSSGSVVPLFQKQILQMGEIHLTDRRMERYFITPEKAISILLKAARLSQGGETFVMNMKSVRIIDLAEMIIELSGKKPVKIVEIGARKGEKLKETLIAENEKEFAVQFDDELFMIAPYLNPSDFPYEMEDSLHPYLSKEEIRTLLTEGDFIG